MLSVNNLHINGCGSMLGTNQQHLDLILIAPRSLTSHCAFWCARLVWLPVVIQNTMHWLLRWSALACVLGVVLARVQRTLPTACDTHSHTDTHTQMGTVSGHWQLQSIDVLAMTCCNVQECLLLLPSVAIHVLNCSCQGVSVCGC